MSRARRIVLAFYGLGVALTFLWVPWTEDAGYRWLWAVPRPITVDKDIVAEARQRWKAEGRANDIATLGQKWAQEIQETPAKNRDKVREELRLARGLANLRQLELRNMEGMSDDEVLAWLRQEQNFDNIFPDRKDFDEGSRRKLFEEWERNVAPVKAWNERIRYAKTDHRRIAMELVVLTALCAVGFLLT